MRRKRIINKKEKARQYEEFLSKQYKLPFIEYMKFELNTDKLYSTLAKYTKEKQEFTFNELVGRKLRYIPSDKIGTISKKGNDLILLWDDGWNIEVILTTEYGHDFMRKSEILPIVNDSTVVNSIKLTIVADNKSVDITSDDFTFSLLRNMYVIDNKMVDGIGCQVNDETSREQIEQLGNDISSALKTFFTSVA